MKLFPSIILTGAIHKPEITGEYDENEIERGARLILEAGGTIRPMIVRRAGVENYTLVDGEFVYLCAVRARQIDPIAGETIDAYILTRESEEAVLAQVQQAFELKIHW